MAEYKYQTRQFTCKKCGITFEISSDSKIEDQKLCNDCRSK
jgi:predicted Zn-ribbon and HTH transcriptional regulator